jgi:hypothetical protein
MLSPLRKKENYSLPWDAFHPSFVADVENYLAYLQKDDIFDDNAPTKPLGPRSIEARRFQLRLFATTLVHVGVEIQNIRSLKDLVSGNRFRQVCQYLHERANKQKTTTVYEYAYAARTMAKYWLKWDERRLRPIKQLCSKLKPTRRGMTRKKNDVDIDIVLPSQVTRWVKLFIERFRGRLGDAYGPCLFPGDGRPYKRGDTFSRQISNRLRATKPSLEVNAHLIRHFAGKLLLERHPGAYGTLGRLLGHKSQAEAYRTYSGQEVRAAFAELDGMITRLRDDHTRNRRARRR